MVQRATSRPTPRPGIEVVVLARRQLEAAAGPQLWTSEASTTGEGGAEKHHTRRHHAQQSRVAVAL